MFIRGVNDSFVTLFEIFNIKKMVMYCFCFRKIRKPKDKQILKVMNLSQNFVELFQFKRPPNSKTER